MGSTEGSTTDGPAAAQPDPQVPVPHPAVEGNVPWLSPDERAAWMALGKVMLKLPSVLDSELARQADLTFFEYLVLAMLSEAPEHSRGLSDLANRTSASLSRLSHALSRLEGKGYVERRRCPGVGRSTVATLTGAGYDKVVATAPGHVVAVRRYVIDALTPRQLEALTAIGGSILERIEPEAPSADLA